MKFENIRAVIWDWNGTLLNDVEYCLNILNNLLIDNQLKPLTLSEYRNIFTFPVKDYYKKAGFDFNKKSFEELGKIFIDNYEKNKFSLKLFDDAMNILEYFNSLGIEQYLLSAYKVDNLIEMADYFDIKKFFITIKGLDNIYASGKEELGILLREKLKYPKDQVILIGDTLHDYQVAQKINVQPILFSNGHQASYKLHSVGACVIDKLKILKEIIQPVISF
ncbi:MAG: HAD hydrolase-like protein [Ignavibacterium sp.]|nr:HAD hydrolase-like protein [Ignavibacterium sp.]MDW8374957.1 HAD hydrolase-like protein [Ignavibacteriales bacterium]